MNTAKLNVDPAEVEKFDRVAHRWWDPRGEFRPLHALNPVRLSYIAARTQLAGCKALDVGCGGGLLTEGLARAGAQVTGLDASEEALIAARLHALDSGLAIDYVAASAEDYTDAHAAGFDVVTCMELLEHVPEPESLIAACARLAKPGGDVFFSTINRNAKAFALAILGAEYLLRLLPRGTHDYERLIRPSELAGAARRSGLELQNMAGMHYNPLTGQVVLTDDPGINYLMHFRRPG